MMTALIGISLSLSILAMTADVIDFTWSLEMSAVTEVTEVAASLLRCWLLLL